MPIVKPDSVNAQYQMGLVKDGKVAHISGYVPDAEGGSIAVVFSELQMKGASPMSKKGLTLTGVACVAGGSQLVPAAYSGRRVQLHLCLSGCKHTGGASCVHLGEWAYLAEGDNGSGGPLMAVLVAVRDASSAAPPGLRPPQQFEMRTPMKATRGPAAALEEWAEKYGISELLELLQAQHFSDPLEIAVLEDSDLSNMLLAVPEGTFPLGTKGRLLLAVRETRQLLESRPDAKGGYGKSYDGKGGYYVGGKAGKGKGGKDWSEPQQGKGWGEPAQEAEEQVQPPTEGFADGPLQELAAGATSMLRQLGEPVPEAQLPSVPKLPAGRWPVMPRLSLPEPTTETTPGGRLLSAPVNRSTQRAVALDVMSLQASAIHEDWTKRGKLDYETAVSNRKWKKQEHQDAAEKTALLLDTMKDSGLDLTREAAGEVGLRELAALWYADQHPKDSLTAEFMRVSAKPGVPRGLLMEGMAIHKLHRGAQGGARSSD